jgi:hypothetical protein
MMNNEMKEAYKTIEYEVAKGQNAFRPVRR